MKTRIHFLLLTLVSVPSATYGVQLSKSQKDALLSRQKWYLNFEFTLTGNGGDGRSNWKLSENSAGLIEVNSAIPMGFGPHTNLTESPVLQPGRFIGWVATLTEAAQAAADQGISDPAMLPGLWFPYERVTNDSYSDGDGGSDTFKGAGTGYAAGVCQLYLDLKQETYEVVFQVGPSDFGSKVIHEWHHKDNNGTEDWSSPGSLSGWFPNEFVPQLAVRKLSQDMKSDGTIAFSIEGAVSGAIYGRSNGSLHSKVSFRLSPSPPSTAKLYLEPADAGKYQQWRPKPGRSDDDPGNSVDVKYTVEETGLPAGQQPKIETVTLRLVNVSRYPGVCMNWPVASSAPPKPDLRFKPVADTSSVFYTMGEDDQSVRIMGAADDNTPVTNTLTILCFDGAAIGDVIAEAQMKDGRILTAELRGRAGVKLLIPDRDEGVSDISRSWRNKYASGQKDDEDEENDPVGDGQKGDGLTLWEEYRGFRQGNVWRDNCEPKKKDLFIDNRVRAKGKAGIALFKKATGLAVHDAMEQGEHQQDRVINFNQRADRHVVDQHCLVLRVSSDPNKGTAEQQFGAIFPGPPKNTLWVNVVLGSPADQVFGSALRGVMKSGNEDACMIAHELGHGIGMYHHGEKDPWTGGIFGVIWTMATNVSGEQILEGGAPIRVVSEPAAIPYEPTQVIVPPETNRRAYLGFQNGQHSGDWDCIMRYHVAWFYELTSGRGGRVARVSPQIPGTKFCSSPAGTEFNTTSDLPNSEFGDADASKYRGDCIHQFVVSDRWNAKSRR